MTATQDPTARPISPLDHPIRRRALEADARRRSLRVTKAEVARRAGRKTPSEQNYLASVLRGETTSAPVVAEVEKVLDQIEAEHRAAA